MRSLFILGLVCFLALGGCAKKEPSVCERMQQAVDKCVPPGAEDPSYLGSQWDNRSELTAPGGTPRISMKDRCTALRPEAVAVLAQCSSEPCHKMSKCVWEADLTDAVYRLPAYPAGTSCAKMHDLVLQCLPKLSTHEARGELAAAWGCEVCARNWCADPAGDVPGLLQTCADAPACELVADCLRSITAIEQLPN